MAVGKAFVPTEMPSLEVWYGSVLSYNPSKIVISDGYRETVYSGSFSFDFFGNVSGTLFSVEEYRGGGLIYSVSDIDVDAAEVYQAIQILGDAQLAAERLFFSQDTLTGSDGSDYLRAYADDDVLEGLGDNDTLDGGLGNDSLFGGGGYDTYVFGGSWGRDVVTDPDSIGGLKFNDYGPEELSFTNDSGDLIITADANEVLFVDYYSNGLNYDFVFSDGAGGGWSIAPRDSAASEGSGTITFTVTRPDPTRDATYYVSTVQDQGATNTGDYGDVATPGVYTGLLNKEIAFGVGDATATIEVSINDDTDIESAETFRLIVQEDPIEPEDVFVASTTFTITDNDAPSGSAPVITGNASVDLDVAGSVGGVTRVTGDQLVDVSDVDGDLSYIRFYDATPGEDGGTLTLDGVPIGDSFVDVGPAGLGRVAYEGGPNEGTNEITVEAFDSEGNDSHDLTITIDVSAPEPPVEMARAKAGIVYLSTSTGALYTWDSDTGSVQLLGNTTSALTDVAIAPDGILYGITSNQLYRIDAETGEAFLVGPLSGSLYAGADGLSDAEGFDISPSGVGRISSGNNSVVAVVDLETGAVSNPFGPSLRQSETSSGDLWFADEDRYFVTTNSNVLLTIVPSTFGEGIADNDFISNGDIEGLVSLAGPGDDQRASLIGFSGNAYYALAEGDFALPGLEQSTLSVAGSITGAARIMQAVTSEPPTVTPSGGTFAPNTSIPLDGNTNANGLFTWSDPDGLADVLEFSVVDQSVGGGYLTLDGNPVAQAERTTITNIPMSEIGRWAFVSGTDGEFDNIGFAVMDSSGNTSDATVAFVESDDAPLEPEPAEVPQHLLEYFAKEAAYSGGLPVSSLLEGSFLNGWTVQHVFAPSGFLAPDTFAAVTLKHNTFGEVLAIRGSSGSKIGDDWFQNFRPGGIALDEFNAALDQFDTSGTVTLRQWLQTTESIAITGHSQGGAQAQYAAIEAIEAGNSPRQVSTFNSAGIPLSQLDRVSFSDFDDIDVRHFVSHGDIVSLTGNTLIPAQVSGFVYYDFNISAAPSIGEVFGQTHQNHWINGELYGLVTPELRMGASDYPAAAVSAVVGGPSLADFLDPDFSLLATIGDADTEFSDALGRALSFLRETWDFVPEALATLQDPRIALPDLLPAVGPLGSLSSASKALERATNLAGATGNTIADTIESIFDSRATLEGLRDTVGFSLLGTLNALFDFWEFGVALHETLKSIGAATSNALVAGTKAFLSTTISIGDFLLDSIASLPENTVSAFNALTNFLDDLGGLSMVTGPIVAVDSPSFRMDLYGVEDAVVLVREPGASVDLPGGKNILIGSLRSLDDGTVREFGIDDAVFVVGEAIANDELARRTGSAILSYDKDGGGEDDFSISLSGDFRLASFETEIVENGTFIRYLGNGAPEATSDAFATSEASSFTTGNVLENDTDEDDDELSIAGLDTIGTLGLVSDNGDGTFDYDPNSAFDALVEGEAATDSFAYFVTDGVETVRGAVTITVTGEGAVDNTAPVANDDSYAVKAGEAVTVAAGVGLLFNDNDADGDDLSVTDVDASTLGTLGMQADGGFSFTSDPGASGREALAYTVSDGVGTAQGTFELEVRADSGDTEHDVTGRVLGRDDAALADTTVLLRPDQEGTPTIVTSTVADGSFSLMRDEGTQGHLDASRDYDVSAAPSLGVSDALNVLRIAVGLDPSWGSADTFDFIAADVDRSGDVGVFDALEVLRHAVGLEPENAPSWVFIDENADLSHINSRNVTYDTGIDLADHNEDAQMALTGVLLGHLDDYA